MNPVTDQKKREKKKINKRGFGEKDRFKFL